MSAMLWMLASAATLAFVVAPLVLAAWGRTLPAEHEALRSVRVAARTDEVFALLADVAAIPRWRREVRRVQILAREPRVRFREHGKQGTLELEIEELAPPTKIALKTAPVRRMVFEGGWTFELADEGDATRVTLTERGRVRSPIARVFATYVLGHGTHVERTLAALSAHFAKR